MTRFTTVVMRIIHEPFESDSLIGFARRVVQSDIVEIEDITLDITI